MLTANFAKAQDTIYVYKSGQVVSKQALSGIDSLSFTYTKPATGTVSDIDGNLYHWITIGTQKWMVENLKTTHFRTGEGISNVTDATAWSNSTFAAWCDYDNSAPNGTKYGHLYNWYAVNDSRKIAPIGWHVSSDAEWTTLINFVSLNVGTSLSVAKALASTSSDWLPYYTAGSAIGYEIKLNNSTGFNALPGGVRSGIGLVSSGMFSEIGGSSGFWNSTEYNTGNAYFSYLSSGYSYVQRSNSTKSIGRYVRCIKD